jgi:hypothetical protein
MGARKPASSGFAHLPNEHPKHLRVLDQRLLNLQVPVGPGLPTGSTSVYPAPILL